MRLLEEQERERKHIQDLKEAFEQQEEVEDIPPIPLDQERFKEAIKSRTITKKTFLQKLDLGVDIRSTG